MSYWALCFKQSITSRKNLKSQRNNQKQWSNWCSKTRLYNYNFRKEISKLHSSNKKSKNWKQNKLTIKLKKSNCWQHSNRSFWQNPKQNRKIQIKNIAKSLPSIVSCPNSLQERSPLYWERLKIIASRIMVRKIQVINCKRWSSRLTTPLKGRKENHLQVLLSKQHRRSKSSQLSDNG